MGGTRVLPPVLLQGKEAYLRYDLGQDGIGRNSVVVEWGGGATTYADIIEECY